MRNICIGLSSLLVLVSPLIYAHAIMYGQVRPHRTTRFVLTIITLLSAWSLWAGGDRAAAFWLSSASAVQAVALFGLSMRRGIGGWSKLDVACLVVAAAGIVLWRLTDRPFLGLLASLVADCIGCVPEMVKTYRMPHTEIWQYFAIDALAAVLGLIVTSEWSFFALSYPLYILLINTLMAGLVVWRGRSLRGRQAVAS